MQNETKPRGKLAIQVVAMPGDTNANGDIFGGWLVSHMDMAAGIEARLRAKSRAVTVAIDSLRFIKPVNVGDTVCCYVDLIQVGRTSMKFHIEVWTVTLGRDYPLKVSEGVFSFVAIDDKAKPHPVDR
jgi:acyl-CoA thioesterase YciA